MSNFFFISDTHFSHAAMLRFENKDGSKLRQFDSVKAMDDCMVERWNATVKPQDHIWHLGDVAMKKEALAIVRKLNGHKRLIMGNHDIFEVKDYLNAGFQKIMAIRVLEGLIMTHIPIHDGSLGRFGLNVHGHLHANPVTDRDGNPDARYCSACVELNSFTPIALEDIKKRIVK